MTNPTTATEILARLAAWKHSSPALTAGWDLHRGIHKITEKAAKQRWRRLEKHSGLGGSEETDMRRRKQKEHNRRYRAERRGKEFGFCSCWECGWQGKFEHLSRIWAWTFPHPPRRPNGYCPQCEARVYWLPLSKAQVMVLK